MKRKSRFIPDYKQRRLNRDRVRRYWEGLLEVQRILARNVARSSDESLLAEVFGPLATDPGGAETRQWADAYPEAEPVR